MKKRHQSIIDDHFQTRCQPCRIAVRADIEKSVHSTENQSRFGAIWTSLSSNRRRIPSPGAVTLRFTADCRLKTAASQRSCNLLFPRAARRCSSTGLLEQMPRSCDRRASARMARTATSPLRSTPIVTPRSPSALAKSKPYEFGGSRTALFVPREFGVTLSTSSQFPQNIYSYSRERCQSSQV